MHRSAIFLLSGLALFAQAPRFDVAAIKPAEHFKPLHLLPGGRVTASTDLHLLIENAFSLFEFQIAGGPGWMKSELFEIDAKAESNPSRKELLTMLQSLIEDRFHMQFHRETKELPVYTLVVAKGGPKLPAPKNTCAGADPTAPLVSECGRILIGRELRNGIVTDDLEGGPVNMAELARTLSIIMGRPVIDKTGFSGLFDVRMDFTADIATAGLPTPALSAPDPGARTIFAAIQEQLGLKLESAKGPVEILVIDHVDKPTGN
jgi:uncharacterized protein (TIGR03435 family)